MAEDPPVSPQLRHAIVACLSSDPTAAPSVARTIGSSPEARATILGGLLDALTHGIWASDFAPKRSQLATLANDFAGGTGQGARAGTASGSGGASKLRPELCAWVLCVLAAEPAALEAMLNHRDSRTQLVTGLGALLKHFVVARPYPLDIQLTGTLLQTVAVLARADQAACLQILGLGEDGKPTPAAPAPARPSSSSSGSGAGAGGGPTGASGASLVDVVARTASQWLEIDKKVLSQVDAEKGGDKERTWVTQILEQCAAVIRSTLVWPAVGAAAAVSPTSLQTVTDLLTKSRFPRVRLAAAATLEALTSTLESSRAVWTVRSGLYVGAVASYLDGIKASVVSDATRGTGGGGGGGTAAPAAAATVAAATATTATSKKRNKSRGSKGKGKTSKAGAAAASALPSTDAGDGFGSATPSAEDRARQLEHLPLLFSMMANVSNDEARVEWVLSVGLVDTLLYFFTGLDGSTDAAYNDVVAPICGLIANIAGRNKRVTAKLLKKPVLTRLLAFTQVPESALEAGAGAKDDAKRPNTQDRLGFCRAALVAVVNLVVTRSKKNVDALVSVGAADKLAEVARVASAPPASSSFTMRHGTLAEGILLQAVKALSLIAHTQHCTFRAQLLAARVPDVLRPLAERSPLGASRFDEVAARARGAVSAIHGDPGYWGIVEAAEKEVVEGGVTVDTARALRDAATSGDGDALLRAASKAGVLPSGAGDGGGGGGAAAAAAAAAAPAAAVAAPAAAGGTAAWSNSGGGAASGAGAGDGGSTAATES